MLSQKQPGGGDRTPPPGVAYTASLVLFAKPFQHHGHLRSCGLALRCEGAFAGAVHDARAAGPLHGGDGILTQIRKVGVAEEVGILTDGHVIALVNRVAVQDRRKLLPRHGIIRAEQAVAVAADDALAGRPADSIGVPRIPGHIGKVHRVIHNRLTLQTIEDSHDHAPAGSSVRRKGGIAGAGHQAVVINV